MTNGTACPDFDLLSRFLDHELGATAAGKLTHHLATCLPCRSRLEDLGQAEGIARTQLPLLNEDFPLPQAAPHCPFPEQVTLYMQGRLAGEEERQIEQHLHTCDVCLHEAKEASRVLVFLSSPQAGPLPASLQAQVAGAWGDATVEVAAPSLPRLVIKLTEWGLSLIDYCFPSPMLRVEAAPSLYRSSALNLQLDAGDAKIDVLAVPEEEGVTVTLTLIGPERTALADRRIYFRQHDTGTAVFSAQTDYRGVFRVLPLKPGIYDVACHEVFTTFQLEILP